MALAPLATPNDVADLWRPLTTAETVQVTNLIVKASAMLRQKVPWVDARIARFAVNSTDTGALDPMTVATVVATVVKRFLVNPDGATNMTETAGPFSHSKGFALRGDKDIRGELIINDSDLDSLMPPRKTRSRIGTIKVQAGLAPASFGDIPYDAQLAGVIPDPGFSATDADGWVG